MKKLLPILSIAVLMVACNEQPKTNDMSVVAPVQQQAPAYNLDTVGLAKFQEWKAQNELANEEDYGREAEYEKPAPVIKPKKAKQVYQAPKKAKPVYASKKQSGTPASTPGGTVSNGGDGTTVNNETANEAKAEKGWSKAAKGAVIGAGTGAAAGAVIYKKNRVIGGVVGGVVGGAVGYGVGKVLDKKAGRK